MEINKYLFQLIKEHKWDDLMKFLKETDEIDVNIKDKNNNYLVNYAVMFNNKSILSLLIHRGARLDVTDSDGRSILYIPIKFNFIDILKLLLDFNESTIGISLIDMQDYNKNIPLHYAILLKNLEFANILLDYGSNPNTTDKNGNNSLILAIYSRSIKLCTLFINHGVNINAKTNNGETALHIACNLQQIKIINLLLNYNIQINAQDYDNEFATLHYAVNLNNIEIVKLLILKNADINIQDFLGNTSLHYILKEDNYTILRYFLENKNIMQKLNFNLFNIYNEIPIHLLLEKKYEEVEDFISSFIQNSFLNFQNNDGNSPLHIIAKT